MKKRNIIVMCICLLIIGAAIAGMIKIRFNSDETDNLNDNAAMNDGVNTDEKNGTSDIDKKEDNNSGNASNDANDPDNVNNNQQSNAVPVTDDSEAILGVDANIDKVDRENSSNNDNGTSGNVGTDTGSEEEIDIPDDKASLTYEEYSAMSSSQQQEYFESYSDPADFFEWYNAAKAAYEEAHPNIDIGDGNIDFGNLGD